MKPTATGVEARRAGLHRRKACMA